MRTRKATERVQCPFCIETREKCRLARHIFTAHNERTEEWINNFNADGVRIS